MKRQTILTAMVLALTLLTACSRDIRTGLSEVKSENNLGNEQGNGTDNVPSGFGAAWVMEPNVIRYCYVLAADFGLPAAKVESELEAAFSIWQEYIRTKKVNESLRDAYMWSHGSQSHADLFNISTVSQRLHSCDGSEKIKFYFGAQDELIAKLKQNYFNPTAFAFKTAYDSQAGVGKGVIWLVKEGGLSAGKEGYPEWELPNRLRGVLLHEIGHTFGIGHFGDTIMREDMWDLLLNSDSTTEDQSKLEYQMGHIDHNMELFFPALAKNTTTYSGIMAFSGSTARAEIEANFEYLTGRKPIGDVVSQFTQKKLTVSDSQSSYTFEIGFDGRGSTIRSAIFKVERTWPPDADGSAGLGFSLAHDSGVATGALQSKGGIAVPILLYQNLGRGPLSLSYLREGQEQALLVMDRL